MHLSNDNCVRPQVNVISNKHQIKNGKYLEGAPDLIVEVLLSATIIKDCEIKKELYAKYGVKEYWIVNPWLKSITIYKLFDSRYKLDGVYTTDDKIKVTIFDDLIVDVKNIFKWYFN